MIDYNFINSFIDEQKSIFSREQNLMSEMFSTLVKEYRTSVVQTGSVCAFIVTIFFGMITANWITEQQGQPFIVISILVAAFLIFSVEFFRTQILNGALKLSSSYNGALWSMSELKRIISLKIVLEEKLDFKILYHFVICVVCSERIKMISDFEDLLKIRIFKMRADNFIQFYSEYEDFIKLGKSTFNELSETFKSTKFLEKLLPAIKPLEDYQIKSEDNPENS